MKRVLLFGSPLGHSLSPAMQNAAFRALGLDWQYELCETTPEGLGPAVALLRQDQWGGANVTVPYKQAVMAHLDGMGEGARHVGAVNTIFRRDEKLIGENTDFCGMIQMLRDANVRIQDAETVILGAGGAARAVAFVLADQGARVITIINRTERRAAELAADVKATFPGLAIRVNESDRIVDAELIVNATSVGMVPNDKATPLPAGAKMARGAVAVDLVYRPLRTRFLVEADKSGARTVDGLGLLVYQGAASFEMWTGQSPSLQVMFDAVRKAVQTRPY